MCVCWGGAVCACAPSSPRRNREIVPGPSAFPCPGLGVFLLTHLKPGTYISFWILDTLCFLPFLFSSLRSPWSFPQLSFSASWVSGGVVSLKPTVIANLLYSFQSATGHSVGAFCFFPEQFFWVVLTLTGVEAWAEPSSSFIIWASIPIRVDWESAKDFLVLPSSFGRTARANKAKV